VPSAQFGDHRSVTTTWSTRLLQPWPSNRDVDGARREPVVAIAIAPLAMLISKSDRAETPGPGA
jgi:hypothetical protein